MSNESETEEVAQDDAEESADAETDAQTEQPVDAEADGGESETDAESGFQDGDFVRVSYTARTVEDGRLVDTTDQEVAEEEGIEEEDDFEPRIIVLGEGHIFPPVEDALTGGEAGDSGSVVVPAVEAFGEVDEDQIRTISADKIPEDDRYPGAHVQIDSQEGHVQTIIGGRARVDFNHPLAGEDIEYEYEIIEAVDDSQEKAEGLLSMFLGMDLDVWFETDTVQEEQLVEPDEDEADAESDEETADDEADADAEGEGGDDEDPEPEYETVEVEKETLYIEATPQLTMDQQWMMGKQQIGQQLTQLLDIDRIIVQEELGGGMGMMGGMPGMGGGGMGGGDVEEAIEELEDEDVDADELLEELEDE